MKRSEYGENFVGRLRVVWGLVRSVVRSLCGFLKTVMFGRIVNSDIVLKPADRVSSVPRTNDDIFGEGSGDDSAERDLPNNSENRQEHKTPAQKANTNVVKFKKLRRSKYEFPTCRCIKQIGYVLARTDIERKLGCSIAHLPTAHTRTQWRWKVPVGMSVAAANEFYKQGASRIAA